MSDSKILRIKQAFDTYPDFPRPGILFYDIFPIFRDPAALDDLIGLMEEKIRANYPSAEMIAGLEARGFLFAPIVAQRLGIGFVPIRKGGKLPGETARISYSLEYGQDCFEIQRRAIRPGQKVLLLDDLLATGGSLRAACQLLKSVEAVCLGAVVVLELSELKGIKIVFLSFQLSPSLLHRHSEGIVTEAGSQIITLDNNQFATEYCVHTAGYAGEPRGCLLTCTQEYHASCVVVEKCQLLY